MFFGSNFFFKKQENGRFGHGKKTEKIVTIPVNGQYFREIVAKKQTNYKTR